MKHLLTVLVSSLLLISGVHAGETVVTLASGEWAPYLSRNLVHRGFASHVVERAFEIAGIKVDYQWYDNFWKRAYKDAKDGKVDGSLVWSRTPEREKEMYYSDPVFNGKADVFFYLKDSGFDWRTYVDLNGKVLGGTIGYNYGEAFNQAVEYGDFRVIRIKNDYLNFKALLLGRIDAFIAGKTAGYKVLKENFSADEVSRITHHKKPVRIATYHLILSRKVPENRAVMEKFNAGITALKTSGEYHEMRVNFENGYYSTPVE
ncbi:MAG: transporter substrate-binding domain-containing protein [Desulfobacter sp.]|nr:MAG: transporter substrate-binding domain-containing protein [Desulfobacter sp.]